MESKRKSGRAAAGATLVTLVVLLAGGIGGACDRVGGMTGLKELQLTLNVSEGVLISHDFTLTNTSGLEITEARLSIQVFGEVGAPVVERYWARWGLGDEQTFSVPLGEVRNLQKVTVKGRADQGRVDLSWTLGD